MECRPIANHAIATGTVVINTANTVPRWNVVSGSPLTFTSTFHVPWTTAAARAKPIATGITAPLSHSDTIQRGVAHSDRWRRRDTALFRTDRRHRPVGPLLG